MATIYGFERKSAMYVYDGCRRQFKVDNIATCSMVRWIWGKYISFKGKVKLLRMKKGLKRVMPWTVVESLNIQVTICEPSKGLESNFSIIILT